MQQFVSFIIIISALDLLNSAVDYSHCILSSDRINE
jgi:hypothetical protein